MIEELIGLGMFIFGLVLMIYSAGKIVKGIVGASLGFGLSAFFITAIFVGFDPENLAAGASGAYEGLHGIAIGSILGAVMVPSALAFGLTVLLARVRFKKVSKPVLLISVLVVVLLFALCLDGLLSRIDGVILIAAFVGLAVYLFKAARKGMDIRPAGELKESLEEAKGLGKGKSVLIMAASIIGIVIGSELLVNGAKPLIAFLGISDTLFGMTILAFLISIEELAKQLPAALKGRSDISYGNMTGSIIHFLLLNAGIIALVNPIQITPVILWFYFPVVFLTMGFISLVMLKKEIPKWAGVLMVLFYVAFVVLGYIYKF